MYLFYNGVVVIPAGHIDVNRSRRGEEMKQERSGSRSQRSNLETNNHRVKSTLHLKTLISLLPGGYTQTGNKENK